MKVVGRVGKNLWMRLEQWTPHQTEQNNNVFLETLPFPVEFFYFFLTLLITFYCWEFVCFCSKSFKKATQFQVPQKQYSCRCLPGIAGRCVWCSCSLPVQPWQQPGVAGCSSRSLPALCVLAGLGSFPHSTRSCHFTLGNRGGHFFGLLFWAGFCCCNMLRRSAGTPSVLLFHYHQIPLSPVGSLQWESDTRPWILNVLMYPLLWSPGKVIPGPHYESSTCQQPDVSRGAFL